jgi:hypothetical protein
MKRSGCALGGVGDNRLLSAGHDSLEVGALASTERQTASTAASMMRAMKLLQSIVRKATFSAVNVLRHELSLRGVTVPMTDASVREFAAEPGAADFLERWTLTDESPAADENSRRLVQLARNYALPRPWKLSVPVASAARHPTPLYLNWASAN